MGPMEPLTVKVLKKSVSLHEATVYSGAPIRIAAWARHAKVNRYAIQAPCTSCGDERSLTALKGVRLECVTLEVHTQVCYRLTKLVRLERAAAARCRSEEQNSIEGNSPINARHRQIDIDTSAPAESVSAPAEYSSSTEERQPSSGHSLQQMHRIHSIRHNHPITTK